VTEFSRPLDGFRLAYDIIGDGPDVVLLHGWPGTRSDYRHLVPLLSRRARLIVPDLRGFGQSDKLPGPPIEVYSATAQVHAVLDLLDELAVEQAHFAGYDIGSRVLQALVRMAPERVAGLVMTPPQPGAGERLLAPSAQREFWYQALHRLELADALLDGNAAAIRNYVGYFWEHWSGPEFHLPTDDLTRLVESYSPPGAFVASIAWYRSRPGPIASATELPPVAEERIKAPTEILWPTDDPLFPLEWADRLDEWFADVRLTVVPNTGHFVPVEAPRAFADAIARLLVPL